MSRNYGGKIHPVDLLAGVIMGLIVGVILGALITTPVQTQVQQAETNTTKDDDGLSVSTKQYDTSPTDFEVACEDGRILNLHTPDGWYNITEQYIDNIASYYNTTADIEVNGIAIVGNADTTSSAGSVINASTLSSTKSLLSQLFPDYDTDELIEAEALTYMRTGEIPETAPDNYRIEVIAEVTVGDTKYTAFEVNYDTVYSLDSSDSGESVDGESTEVDENGNTETIHTQNIYCYSDNDDPIEIIVMLEEFDKDEGLKLLYQFIGYEE